MTEYSESEQAAYNAGYSAGRSEGLEVGASKSIQITCNKLAAISPAFQRNQNESLEDWRDRCVSIVDQRLY